jgi:hypothetical protein
MPERSSNRSTAEHFCYQEALLQIAKLFRLAKNSGLKIAENVQAAVDLLEAKIEAAKAEAAKAEAAKPAPPLNPS